MKSAQQVGIYGNVGGDHENGWKLNGKEIDRRACNMNAVGCAMANGRKELYLMMPRPCLTPGQTRVKSRGSVWRRGKADSWRTLACVGHCLEARSKGIQGGYKQTHRGQGLEAWPKRTQAETFTTQGKQYSR